MPQIILRKADQYATCDPVKLSAEYTGQILDQDLVMDMDVLENGQCVVVKHNAIKAPATATDKVVLNVTPCEIYENVKGRNTFAVRKGKGSDPRLFVLNQADEFQTNAVFYDDAEFTTLADLKTAIKNGTVVAVPDASMNWKLTKEGNLAGTEKVYGEVLAFVVLSNEEDGVLIRIA